MCIACINIKVWKADLPVCCSPHIPWYNINNTNFGIFLKYQAENKGKRINSVKKKKNYNKSQHNFKLHRQQ